MNTALQYCLLIFGRALEVPNFGLACIVEGLYSVLPSLSSVMQYFILDHLRVGGGGYFACG